MISNKICVVGWYFFPELYKFLYKYHRDDVYIVAHRYNKILDDLNLNYTVTENVGLEFGAYDYYIKNIWDKKSNVLLMHDDIKIVKNNIIKEILKEYEKDQYYFFGDKRNKKIIGPHGRMIYMKLDILKLFLKKYNGFYYNKNSNDNCRSPFPFYLINKFYLENEEISLDIKDFNCKMAMLAILYDFDTRNIIYNDNIILYKKGKEKIINSVVINISGKDLRKKERQRKRKGKIGIYNNGPKIDHKYRKFLNGKRVVIVGSSFNIKNSNQKELIESYDIVVRINRGYYIHKDLEKDIGSRTDILYSSLADVKSEGYGGIGVYLDYKRLFNTKWISCSSPQMVERNINFRKFHEKKRLRDKISAYFYSMDLNLYKTIHKVIKRPLNAGFSAICDLLSFDIKELYITGFTFFMRHDDEKSFCYKEYKPSWASKLVSERNINKISSKGHNPEMEFEYFKNRLYRKDSRIKCDDFLKKIL